MAYLSPDDQARIQHAQRVLLSPLQYSDARAWYQTAAGAVQDILQGDHAYAFRIGPDSSTVIPHTVDPAFASTTHAYLAHVASRMDLDDPSAASPMPLRMHALRVQRGSGAYHEQHLVARQAVEQSPFFQDVAAPHGVKHAIGLSAVHGSTETALCVAFKDADAPGFDVAASERLQLLVPAFEAGVRHLHRFRTERMRMRRVLDDLTDAIILFSVDGREQYRNRALRHLFASLRDADPLRHAAEEIALTVIDGRRRVQRTVYHASCRFTVRGTYAGSLFDGPVGVIVTVSPDSPFPPPLHLQTTFDLTPREAEVALLVAQGYTDARVADELSISVHTVRRHVSAARAKLDVDSRTEMAHRLAQWNQLPSNPPPSEA